MDERIGRPIMDTNAEDEAELEEIYVLDTVAVTPVDRSVPDPRSTDIDIARAQIEQTRADVGGTIDAIKEKLNPQTLMQQAKETVREATVGRAQEAMGKAVDATRSAIGTAVDTTKEALGSAMDSTKEVVGEAVDSARTAVGRAGETVQGAGSSVADTIRQNPVAAALAFTGLAWLAISARNRASQARYDTSRYDGLAAYHGVSDGYAEEATMTPPWVGPIGETPSGMGSRVDEAKGKVGAAVDEAKGKVSAAVDHAQHAVGEVVEQAQEKAGAMVGQAREKVGAMASQVQDRASEMATQAQHRASEMASEAKMQAQRCMAETQRVLRENPMAIGGAALALGMMAGFAVPGTPQERRLMGEARDQLVGKAQERIQEVKQKVQTAAQEVVGAAKEEIQVAAQEAVGAAKEEASESSDWNRGLEKDTLTAG